MKKILKNLFVEYGVVIIFYVTIALTTLSFATDYRIYDSTNESTNTYVESVNK